jgi:anti-sigma regulatory factor (Ser/Thr protein kinase)
MEKILILRNEIEEISKLPLFIEELGDELGLSPELIFNLNLVLEEAISNVVLYAYPKEEHEIITLTAKKNRESIDFYFD